MDFCSYCGMGYYERKCSLCGATTEVCGCDFGRYVCEEHICSDCGEPALELNEHGECPECEARTMAKKIDDWRRERWRRGFTP